MLASAQANYLCAFTKVNYVDIRLRALSSAAPSFDSEARLWQRMQAVNAKIAKNTAQVGSPSAREPQWPGSLDWLPLHGLTAKEAQISSLLLRAKMWPLA